MMFTVSPETLPTPELAAVFVKKHNNSEVPRLKKLKDYYKGEHDILKRKKDVGLSNNKIVVNHASYIADISSGYLTGIPTGYKSEEDIETLTEALRKADASVQDADLASDLAIAGRAFELIYMDNGEPARPKLAKADFLGAFVVYDNTVQHGEMFGVTYSPDYDIDDRLRGYDCVLYTDRYRQSFRLDTSFGFMGAEKPQEHFFGLVPLCEYWNNAYCSGDFEGVLPLIDAYNLLASDRVNDKEQFVNSLLVITGQVFGDDDKEKSETYQAVVRKKFLELAEGSKAEFLTRQFSEGEVEILRKAIKEDIHTISKVPDISDSNFAGNVSGVAMAYKLLAFEMLARTKERFFKEGLRYRLKCLANVLAIQGVRIDADNITITMKRSLPVNNAELAEMIATLEGRVSEETLISLLSFVEDAGKEREKVLAEQKEKSQAQDDLFGLHSDGDGLNEE